MRFRRKNRASLTPEQLAAARTDARNSVPEMPSRHIPTEWWVKPVAVKVCEAS